MKRIDKCQYDSDLSKPLAESDRRKPCENYVKSLIQAIDKSHKQYSESLAAQKRQV